MKIKFLLSLLLSAIVAFTFTFGVGASHAQSNDSTAAYEAAGKAIFEKLQSQQVKCGDLNDDDSDALGDYYMGQMMGVSHEAMNATLEQRLGTNGERQMHIAMGKRLSGCDPTASYPSGVGAWPMMGYYNGWNMMGDYGLWNGFPMLLFWILAVIIIIALVRLFSGKHGRGMMHFNEKTALDILKERYAKGEINKTEFEEKKKDLA